VHALIIGSFVETMLRQAFINGRDAKFIGGSGAGCPLGIRNASASMSTAIDGLVKRGLVAREPGQSDRRKVDLSVTDEGMRAFDAAACATRKRVADILSELDETELEQVTLAMATLKKAFRSCGGCEGW
jgi:hypothetical protein